MKTVIRFIIFLCCIGSMTAGSMSTVAFAQEALPHPDTYLLSLQEIEKHKKPYDDPRPYLEVLSPKKVLPPEVYKKLSYDEEEMKKTWSDLVGFQATDEVGKIAPEIKPGKYTHSDLEKHPGFKKLMWPGLYDRIKPGGPPYVGNVPEFEVIPTRQYYWALPIAKASKQNMNKSKLDDQGYIVPETWKGGYPFPRPSGKFKAQQIMYNIEKRYLSWGLNYYILGRAKGYNKRLVEDFDGIYFVQHIRLAGRALVEPYGWFDERAQKRGESKVLNFGFFAPRDIYGAVQNALFFEDPEKLDQIMMYIPWLRRVRKMSATDTQDPVMGTDNIYDDNEGWMQKMSPKRYPYEYAVLEEREYLVPAPTLDGAEYITSDTFEFRNMKFERRPLYVIQMIQKDPNYVYSKRILYIDKETFNYYHVDNFDQKGRLYRSFDMNYSFFPDMGQSTWSAGMNLFRDYVDIHSTFTRCYQLPAFFSRKDLSLKGLMKRGK